MPLKIQIYIRFLYRFTYVCLSSQQDSYFNQTTLFLGIIWYLSTNFGRDLVFHFLFVNCSQIAFPVKT